MNKGSLDGVWELGHDCQRMLARPVACGSEAALQQAETETPSFAGLCTGSPQGSYLPIPTRRAASQRGAFRRGSAETGKRQRGKANWTEASAGPGGCFWHWLQLTWVAIRPSHEATRQEGRGRRAQGGRAPERRDSGLRVRGRYSIVPMQYSIRAREGEGEGGQGVSASIGVRAPGRSCQTSRRLRRTRSCFNSGMKLWLAT
jgi:hypothetical protein